jgi:hypothetical protein
MTKLLALLVTLLFFVSHVRSHTLKCGPLPSDNKLNFRKLPIRKPPPPYPGIKYHNAQIGNATKKYNHLFGAVYPNETNPIIIKFIGQTLTSLSVDYVACGRPGGFFAIEARGADNKVIDNSTRKPDSWCFKDGEVLNMLTTERTISAQDSNGKIASVYFYYIGAGTRCHAKACYEALAIRELRYNCARY